MTAVDLGCGDHKAEGHVGLDRRRGAADVLCDLSTRIPLRSASIDRLRARDFFEHLRHPIAMFDECWRVLVPGGELALEVPRFPHVDAVKDPTHVSWFTVETFTEYFAGPDRLEAEYGWRLWDILRSDSSERRIWMWLSPRRR